MNYIRLGARGYNATNGRFDRIDPKIDEGQHNFTPYHYSFNNPVRFSDADGLMGQDCCGDENPTKDPFIFAKVAATAFYDTKHAIYNTTFRAFGSDLRAGYKVENGSEVFETEFTRKPADNSLKGALKEAVSGVADLITVLPGGSAEGKLLTETSKSQTSRAIKEVVTSKSGKFTEPTLPDKTIVNSNGVEIKHYYKSGDHSPAHLHVNGGGKNTKIGANGKPIKGSSELSGTQEDVINANKSVIRSAGNKINRYQKYHNLHQEQ